MNILEKFYKFERDQQEQLQSSYKTISKFSLDIFNENSMDEQDKNRRRLAVNDLNEFLKEFQEKHKNELKLKGPMKINLFGSTASGFGSKNSDLDCCVTVQDSETGKVIPNAVEAGFSSEKASDEVVLIAAMMQNWYSGKGNGSSSTTPLAHLAFDEVEAVPDAKVPIIRFKHKSSGLEGDVSIYNTLPLRNTKLLHSYAEFDNAVLKMGFLLKKFSKITEICDASKGSLSSYAYIILLIHYLQKMEVIPNLQNGNDVNVEEYCNWNTFFIENPEQIKILKEKYNSHGKSAGELFIGLLKYYAFDFDWNTDVVCIRFNQNKDVKGTGLTCFNKRWTSKTLVIEDPFDLNHNLGTGVSKQMGLYIIKILMNALEQFIKPSPAQIGYDLKHHYFNKNALTKGKKPPQDRLCRYCLHIGHFQKECPKFLQMEKEKEENRERKKIENRNRKQKMVNEVRRLENMNDEERDVERDRWRRNNNSNGNYGNNANRQQQQNTHSYNEANQRMRLNSRRISETSNGNRRESSDSTDQINIKGDF